MPYQTNNLLVLAQNSFQGGNYAQALGFCESILAQSPGEIMAWILKGRCELHLRPTPTEAWNQSRVSLHQALALSRTDDESRQVIAAWLKCFEELNAALEKSASDAGANAVASATTSRLALATSAASGLVALRSKGTAGKIAGTAGAIGAAAAASHYAGRVKTAYLDAVIAHFTRCELCIETLEVLETRRSVLRPDFFDVAQPVLGTLPRALGDMANAEGRLADRKHLESVDVSGFVRIGTRYVPNAMKLAVGDWIKLFALQLLEDQALALICEFSAAMGVATNLPQLKAEVLQFRKQFATALRPYTIPPALVFVFFWIERSTYPVAWRGNMDLLAAITTVAGLIVGLYSAIRIDAVLKDSYPRHNQTRRAGIIGLAMGLAAGILTGWYPLLLHNVWARRAAINHPFVTRFPAASTKI